MVTRGSCEHTLTLSHSHTHTLSVSHSTSDYKPEPTTGHEPFVGLPKVLVNTLSHSLSHTLTNSLTLSLPHTPEVLVDEDLDESLA